MPTSSVVQDHSHLEGFEVEIFKLVQKEATLEQWSAWLRAPLEHAAAKGDINLFMRLKAAGADCSADWSGCHGRTLIGAAACGKNEKIALALLEAGTNDDLDMMFEDHDGRRTSALHEAVVGGLRNMSQALLLAGADPNVLDSNGNSPLDLAAEAGHAGLVSDLLLKGASVDGNKSNLSTTPLHLAAEAGHVLCVSRLLLSGAGVNFVDGNDMTPLLLATEKKHPGVVEKLLVAGATLYVADNEGWSPVELAARNGDVGVLKALLENGGQVDSVAGGGYTALHAAATPRVNIEDNDTSGTVRVLLEAGAEIEAKIIDGSTPLHLAIGERQFATARALLEGGADINARNLAIRERQFATARALLEGGADINARNNADFTPLRYACANSDIAAVELLLCWGADETLTYMDGRTVVDFVGQQWGEGHAVVVTQQCRADDQRIRQMLARAPADRSWRRRGWLVLCRSRPSKVQIARGRSSSSSGSGKPVKGARLNGVPSNRGGEAGDSPMDFGHLVGGVVGLEMEDVFRSVVGFL